jgi:hypothetical protein
MDSTRPSTNVNNAVNTGITRDPMDPIEAFGKTSITLDGNAQTSGGHRNFLPQSHPLVSFTSLSAATPLVVAHSA